MIKIYCLANPFTDIPFYVGSTSGPLNTRLNQHIAYAKKNTKWMQFSHNELKHFPAHIKDVTINMLQAIGKAPAIKQLHECPLSASDHYEQFFFNYFKSQGFYMFQEANRFTYKSTKKTKPRYCKEIILYNKNTSNNIWYL